MPIALIHQLTVLAQANVRGTLRAQPGRSQNRPVGMLRGMMTIVALPVPAQANVRSTLRAQPGRSQNRTLSLMNLDRMTMGAGGGVFGSGITPAARALACTENVPSCCAMEAIDG